MSPEEGPVFYSLEISDLAGNRLQALRRPLKRPEPKEEEKPVEEKKEIWVEDF